MKIPQLILDRWNDVQQRARILDACRARLHRAKDDAALEFERDYLSSRIFVANDDLHKRKVLAALEKQTRQRRQTATGVALFGFEPAMRELERELAACKVQAMRAPDSIDAWLALTGGARQYVADEAQMLSEVGHETRISRWLVETASWQPSRWHREYERAVSELADVSRVRAAASFVMFAEARHGDGWSGPTPASVDEERAAINLRRTIASTQAARIPPEATEIETALDGLKKIASRARSLDGIMPIDPQNDFAARDTFEAEAAELAADAGDEGAAVA